jgi:TatD DNase family protein
LSKKYELSEKEIKNIQKDFFIAQINLAKKYNLPIIIHNRDSRNDILEILEKT